jgi:hypothetical protein
MRDRIEAAIAEASTRLDQVTARHADLTRQAKELNAQGVELEKEQIAVAGELKALQALLKD